MMIKQAFKTGLATAVCAVSFSANAGLIENGSFEENEIRSQGWEIFDGSEVLGWDGSAIEIWDRLGGRMGDEGNQFLELNAGPENTNYTVSQTFATTAGQMYGFSFAYRARKANNGEMFSVMIDDVSGNILEESFNNNNAVNWTTFNGSFTALSANSTIAFTSLGDGSTLGNLIDNVQASSVSVSEPGTLALLGLGLAGLGFARRKA